MLHLQTAPDRTRLGTNNGSRRGPITPSHPSPRPPTITHNVTRGVPGPAETEKGTSPKPARLDS